MLRCSLICGSPSPSPPHIGTLALFRSTSPHFFSHFHMEVAMMFPPGQFSGFYYPTSSLDNPHDQKLSPGTASTIVYMAFINSCLYSGNASNFLRIVCFMTSSHSVSHTLSDQLVSYINICMNAEYQIA